MNVVKHKVWGFDIKVSWPDAVNCPEPRSYEYYQVAAKTLKAAKVELGRRVAYHTNKKPFKIISVKELGSV